MTTRRRLLTALIAITLAAPAVLLAQQSAKVPRIGFLASNEPPAELIEAFRTGLREHGYVEGTNIAIEYRWAAGTGERVRDLATELVRLKVDVIVAWATPAVVAARQASSTVPIVMVGVGDPVAQGFVSSLSRPGGNVTGSSNLARDLSPKLVELLVRLVPGIGRFAVLRNTSNTSLVFQLEEAEGAARKLGLQLQVIDVRAPADLETAFANMSKARAAGLVAFPDPMILNQRRRIADLALKFRLPSVFARGESVDAGGLASYGARVSDQYRQSASYVDRIIKGAKPGDLPVEQPTRFELVINLKTAKALGIKIPQELLLRADRVIE